MLKIELFLADLPIYKRKLIEMPDAIKLQTYGILENPDTIANFTFINNGTEAFTIETEGAHLKYIGFIMYVILFAILFKSHSYTWSHN